MAEEHCGLCAVAEADRWRLDTLPDCALVIGRYPRFRYNAAGGVAYASAVPAAGSAVELSFAPAQTSIPALCSRTTRFLGLPLPPGLGISIEPQRLEGVIEPDNGVVNLQFEARFRFELRAGGAVRYRAPDLIVNTTLTTGTMESRRHRCKGRPQQGDQPGLLVGAALVEPCGEAWLDRFLGLPDEALAVLAFRLRPLR
jgi:hypothetical protein